MRTVVLGPPPPEIEALIARRRRLGLDKYDEVWSGEYHMLPMAHSSHGWLQMHVAMLIEPMAVAAGLVIIGPFNLGSPDDFRVPDFGLHRQRPHAVWVPTAAIVGEIESPDDETWEKLPFYASHRVDEVLVVSAERRSATWLLRDGDHYVESEASGLLGAESARLTETIDWPDPPA